MAREMHGNPIIARIVSILHVAYVALVLKGRARQSPGSWTDRRAKPAAYPGGKFRIVDFALSNQFEFRIHNNRRDHPVLGLFHSPLRHLQRGLEGVLRGRDQARVSLISCPPRSSASTSRVSRHRGRGLSEPGHPSRHIGPTTSWCSGRPCVQENYALMLCDRVEQGRECTVARIEVPRS